jgi:hypothetical protein
MCAAWQWSAFSRCPDFSPQLSRHVIAANIGGYVAPILNGVWATAPYLHNGSVPTLWHLMHPESRPCRFEVGGHKLDSTKVGIAGKVMRQQAEEDRNDMNAGLQKCAVHESYE